MLFETKQTSLRAPSRPEINGQLLTARLDRIPVWALSSQLLAILCLGFLFTFFSISSLGVTFTQACTQIIAGCIPVNAVHYVGLPVLVNLVGYVIGALVFGYLADRYGRRDILVVTMAIIALGSLYTSLASNYFHFTLAGFFTGIGTGAALTVIEIYTVEIAPVKGRLKYGALLYTIGVIGSGIVIWLSLILTTAPAPIPFGLPIALASPTFQFGWRIIYGIVTCLGIVGVMLRFEMVESPRWLIARGRLSEAERLIEKMEQKALQRLPELPPIPARLPLLKDVPKNPYIHLLGNVWYVKRSILLLTIWILGLITVYAIATATPVILVNLGNSVSQAGFINDMGVFSTVLAVFSVFVFAERIERKYWFMISACLYFAGIMVFAIGGSGPNIIGDILMGFGFNMWTPVACIWSAENFPTLARASGSALTQGLGHVGGGIGLIFITRVLKFGPALTFTLFALFLLLAAVLALFGPTTRNIRLDELAP